MRFTDEATRKEQTMAKAGIMKNTILKGMTSGLLAAGLLLAGVVSEAAEPNYPQLPELNWEQRSDWLNVKTGMAGIGPAAVGDGVADDTAALQAACNMARHLDDARFSTVYLPPGTYRITSTIEPVTNRNMQGHERSPINIRGHGRSTRIVWDGPEGGTMFSSRGMGYSSYIGLVWDGRGKAARGWIDLPGAASHTKHQHSAFMNFTDIGAGTIPGGGDYLDSSQWRNCLFINCGKGLSVANFNDYNWTIDGCNFYDCGYGIWNRNGNFYARNCHFQRSKQADIGDISGIHGSSARRCTSVGSRSFLEHSGSAMFTVQDCHVSGWTNPDGAIRVGSPTLIFDCVFTNAPSANPPVPLNGQSGVHSDNRTSTAALFGGDTTNMVEVPPGKRGGSITSAQQSFFSSEAAIPTRVFDVKRDFGGDVQRAIDAARGYGRGAVAYLPRGNYQVSRTINITGANYYVQGAGIFSTGISWRGDKVGPVILVSDPQNVTLEHMAMRHTGGVVALRQVSTIPRPSRMHYEHLELGGGPTALPHTFTERGAFEAVGLSKDSVVTIWDAYSGGGGMSFDNCSSARILFNVGGHHSMGCIRVKGTQIDRSGFFGIQTCQSRLRIEDNQSVVASDVYVEQMGMHTWSIGSYAHLQGSPTLPAGRVTISGPKICGLRGQGSPSFENYFTVNDYRGQLSSVMSQYYNPNEGYDPDKKAFKIVCTGEAPLDVLLMANQYQQASKSPPSVLPVIEGGPNVTRTLLGTRFSLLQWHQSAPVPNVLHTDSLRLAAQALDHFRELGEHDLRLNYPELAGELSAFSNQ
jgi:hypothetical protein